MISKKEQFCKAINKIVYSNREFKKIYEEYSLFLKTQKILKKNPKNTLKILVEMIVKKHTEEFLKTKLKSDSLMEYIYTYTDYIDKLETAWNYKYKLEYAKFKPINWKVESNFKNVNPFMHKYNMYLKALMSVPAEMLEYKNEIIKKLNELDKNIPFKGMELLIRLPVIKNYIENTHKWLLIYATSTGIDLMSSPGPEAEKIFNEFFIKKKMDYKYKPGKNNWNYPLNV